MEFGVLGAVQAVADGEPIPLGSRRERFVLATLLLNEGQLISAETLIAALWAEPPSSARAQVHNLVSRLRQRLQAAPELIATQTGGYEVNLAGHQFDVLEFRRLAEQARQAYARGDHAAASATAGLALDCWRGPALADVPDELAEPVRSGLHQERLTATEVKLDAELALGRHDETLLELAPLLVEQPYSEGLWQRQMLALAGGDRRAEALATYREVYQRFATDLGLEPGPRLQQLHQRILRGESVAEAVPRLPTVPRQLPPAVTLTGRDALLDGLTSQLSKASGPGPAAVLLSGPGGVGKSALAITAGHRLGEVFCDGQLYANLRGGQPEPADPHQVAGQFLRALGVAGTDVPADPDERLGRYRSELAGGRILVVLDDAANEAQVRPLLPGAVSCGVVITSRSRLAALTEATQVLVPTLTVSHGVRLLARQVGDSRVADDPEPAAAITRLCGGLPLAVCIAAARLALNPQWTLADFEHRLSDERHRLDELSVGDLDVRASVELSYQALPVPARTLFRRLGMLTAPDWPAWVADAVLGESAAELLDQLVDIHLVQGLGVDRVGQRRYRLHDVIAAYASERQQIEADDTDGDVPTRLVAGWLGLASSADQQIPYGTTPGGAHLPAPPPPEEPAAVVADQPYPWFEVERPNLVAAVGLARERGDAVVAGALALRMCGFLALRGYDTDRERVLTQAVAAASAQGAERLRAALLSALFETLAQLDRRRELPAMADELLGVARRTGDQDLLARALNQAGRAARFVGEFRQARRLLTEGVRAARQPGASPATLGTALLAIGALHSETGEPAPALPLLAEAVTLSRGEGEHRRAAQSLHVYAQALTLMGELEEATRVASEAMALTESLADQIGTAYLRHACGEIAIWRGDWGTATDQLRQALDTHERLGDRAGVASVSRSLGDLALGQGHPDRAMVPLHRALATYQEIGLPLETARVVARLHRAAVATAAAEDAASYRKQLDMLLEQLGLGPECLRLPPFRS